MRNAGKRFEADLAASIADHNYCYRLRDCGGWGDDQARRFTPSNGCDYFVYSRRSGVLCALELKSTKGTSIRFDALRKVQRDELLKAASRQVLAGALVEWRADPHEVMFVPILAWTQQETESEKRSMNRNECRQIGEVVPGAKRITRYRYDLSGLLRETS